MNHQTRLTEIQYQSSQSGHIEIRSRGTGDIAQEPPSCTDQNAPKSTSHQEPNQGSFTLPKSSQGPAESNPQRQKPHISLLQTPQVKDQLSARNQIGIAQGRRVELYCCQHQGKQGSTSDENPKAEAQSKKKKPKHGEELTDFPNTTKKKSEKVSSQETAQARRGFHQPPAPKPPGRYRNQRCRRQAAPMPPIDSLGSHRPHAQAS